MSLAPDVAAVRLGVRRVLGPFDPGAVVLVACSGGADSLALLAACVFEGHKLSLQVVGVTVDHGLQDGSAAHADRVRAQMADLGVDETAVVRVRVDAPGVGPEAAARQARYAALEQCVESFGATVVLLGHTLDDQAETALLGLTRGAGGRSIAGMRPSFDHYRRPLLGVRRSQTEAACRAEGIEWWTDPHNAEPRFVRSRVRHSVLPMLERELGPGVTDTLARTAEMLRPDMEALDELAAELLARAMSGPAEPESPTSPELRVSAAVLAAAPAALRTRALHQAALRAGAFPAELAHGHVMALDALLTDWHGQGPIDLPGHLRCVRRDGALHFLR